MLDLNPIFISVKVAVISTLFVMVVGIAAAWVMHQIRFPGQDFVETIIGLPLVLPPTVIGFGLLLLFGRNGPLGSFLEDNLHVQIVFTWWAAVIAAAIVSLPLMYRSTKAALETVDRNLERAARTLGASEWKVFYAVTLPLAWPGIIAGILLAFTRALGEFGATLMLAGNIPGKTQTIPLAIYFATEAGDMKTAGYLVLIITVISFAITYGVNLWSGKKYLLFKQQRSEASVRSSY